ASAESGAAWALMLAAECHEHLKHWDQAEQLIRQTTKRYPGQEFDWYYWCRRTGHGDVEAALQLAMQQVGPLSKRDNGPTWSALGMLYWVSGKTTAARSAYRNSLLKSSNPWDVIGLAFINHEVHDPRSRDGMLAQLVAIFDKMPAVANE